VRQRKHGDSWSELVHKLGVSTLTLQRWWSSPPSGRSREVILRRVEVAEPASAERTIVLVSPTGLRIEGLTIAEVIAILRGLA
jgi:hypothetical protein